jgi:hypothetical protein
MSQWRDYGISQVHYNSDRSHIESVMVHEIGEGVRPGHPQKRSWVVNELLRGKGFTTIVKRGDGNWAVGAEVTEFAHTVKFLKTAPDSSTRDNLGSLPEF